MRRVGANQPVLVNVRILAATSRDLKAMVQDVRFREDLFYRLNVVPVCLPPLRERREEIPPLAEHFLGQAAQRQGRPVRLSPEALERLLRYPWPGNVRELENAMEHAAILARGELVTPEELPAPIAAGIPLGPAQALPTAERLAEVEKAHILQVLERVGGHSGRAAEALGISRSTLWRKLREYGIEGSGG